MTWLRPKHETWLPTWQETPERALREEALQEPEQEQARLAEPAPRGMQASLLPEQQQVPQVARHFPQQ